MANVVYAVAKSIAIAVSRHKIFFERIDITVRLEPLLQLGIPIQDSLKSLHVQNNVCKICQGVDGFIPIWEHTPGFRWLSCIIRIKLIYVIATFLYAKFVAWRFHTWDTRNALYNTDISFSGGIFGYGKR